MSLFRVSAIGRFFQYYPHAEFSRWHGHPDAERSFPVEDPPTTSVVMAPPDTRNGDIWKWNFDIQRELPRSIALTIAYVGNKGTYNGNSIGNFNDAKPSPNTDIQSRRLYQQYYDPALPQFGVQQVSTMRYLDSYGNSFYNALQTKVDKRFARGVSLGAAYTFSKANGDGEARGNEGVFYQRILATGWELPEAHMQRPLKHILGGWQSNGVLSLRSGFPFTPSQGNDLNTGSNARPAPLANSNIDNANRAHWLDTSAFQRATCNIPGRPDLCHFGNAGVGVIRDPGQRNLDFSLAKNFIVTERVRVQFRSEFFNAFNTPYFGDPNNIGLSTINSITPDAPRVGEIRSLRTSLRIVQFGLKLSF